MNKKQFLVMGVCFILMASLVYADEVLYLFNRLEITVNSMGTPESREALKRKINEIIENLNKTQKYIIEKRLPLELLNAYEDAKKMMESLNNCLVTIDDIESKSGDESLKNAGKSFWEGVKLGFETKGQENDMRKDGLSSREAKTIGAIYALVKGVQIFQESLEAQKQIDAKRMAYIKQAFDSFGNEFNAYKAKINLHANILTAKYGWEPGEADFLSEDVQKQISDAIQNRDIKRFLEISVTHCLEKCPRNPFRVFATFWGALNLLHEQGQNTKNFVKAYIPYIRNALESVPNAPFFNKERIRFWHLACIAFSEAHLHDDVIKLANQSLQVVPDQYEFLYMKAVSMLFQRNLEESEPILASLLGKKPNDSDLLYNTACWFSLSGKADGALDYLKASMQNGFCNIRHAVKDEGLSFLRREKANEFRDLVKVCFTWTIDFGIFNDDILCTNKSQFTITNVLLKGDMETKEGSKSFELKASRIGPNQTYRWENVFSLPRGTSGRASLTCDQNRQDE